ncbi:MAG: tetratricopeptide repeat protein, partial [Verrucomicrobiota bacterium]
MRFLYPIFTFLFAAVSLNAANLTWSPDTGYVSDEVELSGLLPEEISKILRWMNDARAAEEKGRYKTALGKYKRVQKKFPKSQYAPEAIYRTAQIQLKRNKIDHAFEAFELVSFVYPNYGSFNEIIGEMY